jgi:hypothetical protein
MEMTGANSYGRVTTRRPQDSATTKKKPHFALTIARKEVAWIQGATFSQRAMGRNGRYERPQDGQLSSSLAFSWCSQMKGSTLSPGPARQTACNPSFPLRKNIRSLQRSKQPDKPS